MSDWSAGQYLRFADERTRPVRDLLAAVPTPAVKRAVDLGCGPGNSTEALLARFPGAAVEGVDLSADMLREARARLPAVRFERVDVAAWDRPGPWDVILSNAVLQWVPDHATLLPRLAGLLAPGGSLAFQVPDNADEPSHVLMREVAAAGPWAGKLATAAGERTGIAAPAGYYATLRPRCARVDVWRTTYHHPLPGAEGIIEWFKGSALRPFLRPLGEGERAAFLGRYRDALARAYPAQPDGTALLAFPRLFVVATR